MAGKKFVGAILIRLSQQLREKWAPILKGVYFLEMATNHSHSFSIKGLKANNKCFNFCYGMTVTHSKQKE